MAGLYIHVPFCARKCDYCAFYSYPEPSANRRRRYLETLDSELRSKARQTEELVSVFIGGGTPTSLDAAELKQLLTSVNRHFSFADKIEFTVEANPETLTPAKVELLPRAGVNRVSLGVQTFSPSHRQRIGRTGNAGRVHDVIRQLRANGISNISCDLIYGLPEQTLEDWHADLQRVTGLEPQHASAYNLTVEPGTPLVRRAPALPDDVQLIDMWQLAQEVLGAAGLPRYEISNYARPGRACRHNLDIWYGKKLLGAGPAAHWFDGESRWANPADLDRWLAGEPPAADRLSAADRAVEILITGLRVVDGWSHEQFGAVTGFHWDELRGEIIGRLIDERLLSAGADRLCATKRGMLLSDHVARELL